VQSFNQPRFYSNVTWNPYAITFASSSIIGSSPSTLFINRNDNVFVVRKDNGNIMMWDNPCSNQKTTISTNLSSVTSLFVTNNDEIFISGSSNTASRVERWLSNGTQLSIPLTFSDCSLCYGLFVDISNNLYCSQQAKHQVVTQSLNDPSSTLSIVAGVGRAGSVAHMLYYPIGIFVTIHLDLHVADCNNDRVQLFRSGEINATTVAGTGAGNIVLDCPSAVTLDGNGYLFIVEQYHHRVVRSGPGGYQCVVWWVVWECITAEHHMSCFIHRR
jgi:hypothetical protein